MSRRLSWILQAMQRYYSTVASERWQKTSDFQNDFKRIWTNERIEYLLLNYRLALIWHRKMHLASASLVWFFALFFIGKAYKIALAIEYFPCQIELNRTKQISKNWKFVTYFCFTIILYDFAPPIYSILYSSVSSYDPFATSGACYRVLHIELIYAFPKS